MLLLTGMTRLESFFNLVGLLIVFAVVLILTYFTTRWIGKNGVLQQKNKNIKTIETHKVGQNKFIQIVQIGEKFIAIGIGKEHIDYLTELEKEELIFPEEKTGVSTGEDFKDMLTKFISQNKFKKKN